MTDHQSCEYATALDRDGFVHIAGFLGAAEVSEVRENLQRVVAEIVPTLPRAHVFYENKEDPTTLKQIQKLGEHDDFFGRWQNEGKFRELAEVLLDGPVVPVNTQFFNKPPGVGRPTPPHQDGYYFMLDPCEAVTMWLALDDVDQANGCVRYVSGSHRRGMRDHVRTDTLGFSQGIAGYPTALDSRHEVCTAAQPGDLLAHHALTIHRADGNTSQNRARRSIGLVYYSERAREDTAAKEAYQRRLEHDMTRNKMI